jgi:xylulokinase
VSAVDPADLPVWLPYVRGERSPLHRRDIRGSLHGLSLAHGPEHLMAAAFEASGFVARHHIDLARDAGLTPRRVVATGGGTNAAAWMQALADATQLPVDVVAVPEGAALGSAFIARCVAGLEEDMTDARRWAKTGHTVEPRPSATEAVLERYEQFRALTSALGAS